jgi:hypothetical protein
MISHGNSSLDRISCFTGVGMALEATEEGCKWSSLRMLAAYCYLGLGSNSLDEESYHHGRRDNNTACINTKGAA